MDKNEDKVVEQTISFSQNLIDEIFYPNNIVARNRGGFADPVMNQIFALPKSIIYYILKNPKSHDVYRKLISACKYFYQKNSILVVQDVFCRRIKGSKPFTQLTDALGNKLLFEEETFSFEQFPGKIWITGKIQVVGSEDNMAGTEFLQSLYSKLYRCEGVEIDFSNVKELDFLHFKTFTSFAKSVTLKNCSVVNAGKEVNLVYVIGSFSYVKNVHVSFGSNNTFSQCLAVDTLAGISKAKIVANNILRHFFVYGICGEALKPSDILSFIKDHDNIEIEFGFNSNISRGYTECLNELVDHLIENGKGAVFYPEHDGQKAALFFERRDFKRFNPLYYYNG